MNLGIQDFFVRWVKVGAVVVLLLSLLGYLADYSLVFELTSHFKFQYLVLSVVGLGVFLAQKNVKWMVVATVCVLLNAFEVVPWYFSLNTNQINSSKTLTLLQSNVLTRNQNHQKLIDLIRKEKPDLLFLQEVNARWINSLQVLKDEFPYQFNRPSQIGHFGIAVWSRKPFDDVKEMMLGEDQIPSVFLKIQHSGKKLSILSSHTLPPTSWNYYERRNKQLKHMANFLKKEVGLKILIGDLNVTLWSSFYKKMAAVAELKNVRKGYGILPTWPVQIPFFKIPIDHCLVSKDIQVQHVEVLPSIGSDHRPLLVKLGL